MPPGYSAGGPGPLDGSLVQLAVYGVAILAMTIFFLLFLALLTLPVFFLALGLIELVLRTAQNAPDPVGKFSKIAGLVFRSLRRNLLRTSLTYAALFILTGMLTMLYCIVLVLGEITREREDNLQVIMTEKYSIPSMMPPGYGRQLKDIIATKLPPESRPAKIDDNFMTWSFIAASLDPNKFTKENSLFFICVQPNAVLTMMNDLGINRQEMGDDDFEMLVKAVDIVKQDKRNVVIGQDMLKKLGKEVGDEIKVYGLNYKEIEFECRIVAAFPSGRNGQTSCMRSDYLESKLDEYKAKKGVPHPVADRCLNLVWVRLPNKASYEQLAAIVNDPSTFNAPQVKLETASAAFASFLEPFKDIVWGMKWIIMPAIMVIMCLVVGITITIGVRERRGEMAVMKVLGFLPRHITAMIAAEAVLIGLFGSMLSTWCVYLIPRFMRYTGLKTKIAMIDTMDAPAEILLYGPALGVLVGLIGALLPAASAQRVKVSQIFSKVA